MSVLIDLFFLVDLFFLIDFLHEAAPNLLFVLPDLPHCHQYIPPHPLPSPRLFL